MQVLANVVAVHSFPLKSAGEPRRDAVDIEATGVRDDRAFALVDATGAALTAAEVPGLREVVADVEPGTGTLCLVTPSGERVAGEQARAILAGVAGRTVDVLAVDAGRRLEAPVHLVSRQAVDAALRGEHEAADCACSLEEPRANLELDLADPAAGWESGWTGRVVEVGTARLALHRRPGHCLGVYAEVLRPGRVQVGDVVRSVEGDGS